MNRKEERKFVHNKFLGHCAYCGKSITVDNMQVDHIEPIYRGTEISIKERKRLEDVSNKNPACRRCNHWKAVWSVEEFREQISLQRERLSKVAGFNLALDFNLVKFTPKRVVFYFEKEKW